MKTGIECIPCMYRTYMDVLERLGLPEEEKIREAKWYCANIAKIDENLAPGCNVVYGDRLWEMAGGDCYAEEKMADNRRMLEVSKEIAEHIRAAEDPFGMAVRYAIAGNIIDPTAHYDEPLEEVLAAAAARPMAIDDIEVLREALKKSKKIVYVTDNAGEIVADKLLIETIIREGYLTADQIVVAVRSTHFANDAMMEDAEFIGLTDIVKVIGTGSEFCTVHLPSMSEEFLSHYHEADLMIAKGMANFESVCELRDKPCCMILMTKCIPVSRILGTERGAFVCKLANKELLGL